MVQNYTNIIKLFSMALLNNEYNTTTNPFKKDNAVNLLTPLVGENHEKAAGAGTGTATKAKPAAPKVETKKVKDGQGPVGEEDEKKIIAELSKEFGVQADKSGNTKEWANVAKKSDGLIQVFEKDGKEATKYETIQNKTVTFNSKTYGAVTIQVGGDGELNGKDDTIISMGQKNAVQGADAGLNNILGQQQDTKAADPKAADPKAADQNDPFAGLFNDQKALDDPNAQDDQTQNANPIELESRKIVQNHKKNDQMGTIRGLAGNNGVKEKAEKDPKVANDMALANDPYALNQQEIDGLIAALQLLIR